VVVVDPQEARLVGLRGQKTDCRDCRALLDHVRAGKLVAVRRLDAGSRENRQLIQGVVPSCTSPSLTSAASRFLAAEPSRQLPVTRGWLVGRAPKNPSFGATTQ
jgi:hypothetical protein